MRFIFIALATGGCAIQFQPPAPKSPSDYGFALPTAAESAAAAKESARRPYVCVRRQYGEVDEVYRAATVWC